MFLQLVRDNIHPQHTLANVRALFQYHPLQLTALVETAWRNRQAGNAYPFDAWPQPLTDAILTSFPSQPGLVRNATYWDHHLYAYLIENTGIHEIFKAVLAACQHDEDLQVRSPETQRFLRNTEYLLYTDPAPTTVWNLTSRTRKDESALRKSNYWRLFGLELTHGLQQPGAHPFDKAKVANTAFVPTLETLLGEVWQGITNARNSSGANETDREAVRTGARYLYDMLVSRRQFGNLATDEFRDVAVMSWLHLAVMFNSPIVIDLRAEASSPELRLARLAERVGLQAHPQSQALFQLAQPASLLVRAIEQGVFNTSLGAQTLYLIPWIQRRMELIIDQYGIAMGRDVKTRAVNVVPKAVATDQRPTGSTPALNGWVPQRLAAPAAATPAPTGRAVAPFRQIGTLRRVNGLALR